MKKNLTLWLMIFISSVVLGQTTIQMPLPAHSTVFTGNTRGYWFTAPTCFTITGAEVPTDASNGNQSIAIVRFNAVPPIFSATTNDFTTLFLVQNGSATGMFPMNIQVETGDIIGVLGCRGNDNSYSASGTFSSIIEGYTIPITRLGMQFPLISTPPQQIWAQASGAISRVFLYYDSLVTYNATAAAIDSVTMQLSDGSDSSFFSVWDYGDGSILDTVWNPQHTYTASGSYTACSYITNACSTDTVCTTFNVCGGKPVAGFSHSYSGTSTIFTDTSFNAVTWEWDFGDGSPVDNSQNPVHTFPALGGYLVSLISTNICGVSDTVSQLVIACADPLNPGFTTYLYGSIVGFVDTSTYATAWLWDFGDGSPQSTQQNPYNLYDTNGFYNVCLIATNLCGVSDTACQLISACPDTLQATYSNVNSGLTITFTDVLAGASGFVWDFGDGNSSLIENPVHTYSTSNIYTTCLTAWNICGDTVQFCDTIIALITGIAEVLPDVSVNLFPNPLTESAILKVQSTNYSGSFDFELYDVLGSMVMKKSGIFNQELVIQKGILSPGIYYYTVKRNTETLAKDKLVIQ